MSSESANKRQKTNGAATAADYRVTVVGIGKMGFPLATQFASKGAHVTGADLSQHVVDCFKSGRAFETLGEPQVPEMLAEAHAKNLVDATTDTPQAVRQSNAVVIIVPVLVGTEAPHAIDLGAMQSATRAVARGLQPGTLVSFETTLPVGTTRNVLTPILEEESKLKAGKDFYVCFSPERVYSGRVIQDLANYPKLVGGLDQESTKRAVAFYSSVLSAEVIALDSAEEAEMVKLAETTYRDVNIAFANELAKIADSRGLNVHRVIEMANTQPFSHIHAPGVGVGGHCIPVYPRFLVNDLPADQMLIARTSRDVNDQMGLYAAQRAASAMALPNLAGKNVLILGLAYRGGVKEAAFSSAFKLAQGVEKMSGNALVTDTLFSQDEIKNHNLTPSPLYPTDTPVHVVILQAAHQEYKNLDWSKYPDCAVAIDGRGLWTREDVPSSVKLLWVGKSA